MKRHDNPRDGGVTLIELLAILAITAIVTATFSTVAITAEQQITVILARQSAEREVSGVNQLIQLYVTKADSFQYSVSQNTSEEFTLTNTDSATQQMISVMPASNNPSLSDLSFTSATGQKINWSNIGFTWDNAPTGNTSGTDNALIVTLWAPYTANGITKIYSLTAGYETQGIHYGS